MCACLKCFAHLFHHPEVVHCPVCFQAESELGAVPHFDMVFAMSCSVEIQKAWVRIDGGMFASWGDRQRQRLLLWQSCWSAVQHGTSCRMCPLSYKSLCGVCNEKCLSRALLFRILSVLCQAFFQPLQLCPSRWNSGRVSHGLVL